MYCCQMQDADEFFNVLFYQLEVALKESPQPRILQSLFGGYIVNQIVSKEKGKLSERIEPFVRTFCHL